MEQLLDPASWKLSTADLIQQMEQLLDPASWKLSTADLIQQLSTLVWLNKGDPELFKLVTTARVGYELYNRLSSDREIEMYQTMFIMGIVEFVQKHPKASETELAKEVQQQLELFKTRIESV